MIWKRGSTVLEVVISLQLSPEKVALELEHLRNMGKLYFDWVKYEQTDSHLLHWWAKASSTPDTPICHNVLHQKANFDLTISSF